VIHELALERRALHGHFSRELQPVLAIDPGDAVRFATLDAGHALTGPIEVRGARAGMTLAVAVDELRVGRPASRLPAARRRR
jgi:acetamidase/formamidase